MENPTEELVAQAQEDIVLTDTQRSGFARYWNRLKAYLHPSPEEQRNHELQLARTIEWVGGFNRRSLSPLQESEYPDEALTMRTALGIPFEELDYDTNAQNSEGSEEPPEPISRKKRFAWAMFSIPISLYAVNAPAFLGKKYYDNQIQPRLNPLNPDGQDPIDVDFETHGICSVDIFNPEGELLSSMKPPPIDSTGDAIIRLHNLDPDTLVGTDCSPDQAETLRIANRDASYYVDMLAWAAWLGIASRSWHRDAMGIDIAHSITTGNPDTTIAVIESAFDPGHLEMANSIASGQMVAVTNQGDEYEDPTKAFDAKGNAIDGVRYSSSAIDHGTAVAGSIAAEPSGISPRIKVAFVEGDSTGLSVGVSPNVIEAIEFAINSEVDVINLSYGAVAFNQAEYETIKPLFERAHDQGTFIVIAAGNFGDITELRKDRPGFTDDEIRKIFPLAPQGTLARLADEFDNVVLVEATTEAGGIPAFSNLGEVGAPGENVITPHRRADPSNVGVEHVSYIAGQSEPVTTTISLEDVIASGYEPFTGTSISSPLVAGAIALAISVNPDLKDSPDEMMRILKLSEIYNNGLGINVYYILVMALAARLHGFQTDYSPFMPNKLDFEPIEIKK